MPKAKRKKRPRRQLPLWMFGAALLAMGWGAFLLTPPSSSSKRIHVTIVHGARTGDVALALQHAGVIRNATAFALYAYATGDAHHFRAGTYRISPSQSPAEIIEILKRGIQEPEGIVVTIPEGYTVRQIAAVLQQRGVIVRSTDFEELAHKPEARVVTPFPLPSSGLEGYLWPDTYRFMPNTAPERVAQAMVDVFARRFSAPYAEEMRRDRYSLHRVVTIASLIEREARVDGDRARISGVIENRLRRGMRLQIDATVLYAMGYHKSRVLFRDLKTSSPYNTYMHKGLPPGPIASPGLPSLLAALRPERNDYLYYVAAPDGSHVFTRTPTEHAHATARMRALRKGGAA